MQDNLYFYVSTSSRTTETINRNKDRINHRLSLQEVTLFYCEDGDSMLHLTDGTIHQTRWHHPHHRRLRRCAHLYKNLRSHNDVFVTVSWLQLPEQMPSVIIFLEALNFMLYTYM
jgi:hypothetical protein